jgi:tetratricopeptide (TPR) repeat protein
MRFSHESVSYILISANSFMFRKVEISSENQSHCTRLVLMNETADFEAQTVLPLIGRHKEWNAVRQIVDSAENGSGSVLFIAAPVGYGKTRMIDEAYHHATAQNIACLYGQGNRQRVDLVYGLFENVFEGYLAQGDAAARKEMAGCVAKYAPHLWPLLFPDQEIPKIEESPTDDPKIRQAVFVAVITRILSQLASARGFILFLDDAHLSDPGSQVLIRQLIRTCRGESAFQLVISYDLDEAEAIDPSNIFRDIVAKSNGKEKIEELTLGGLDEGGVAELIRIAADGAAFTTGMVRKIQHDTGGSPLHILQYVEDLSDKGKLQLKEFVAENPTESPNAKCAAQRESLSRLLRQRLARLPTNQQTLLGHAAQQGSVFTGKTLALTLRWSVERVIEGIKEILLSSRLIHIRNKTFSFTHPMIGDFCIQLLNDSERRAVHLALGTALEQIGADPERLAHHFYWARDYRRALPYQIVAADNAENGYAYATAHRLLKQAHEAIENHGVEVTEEVETGLLMSRAQMGSFVNSDENLISLYEKIIEKGNPESTAKALVGMTGLKISSLINLEVKYMQTSSVPEAKQSITTAMNIFENLGDEKGRGRCLATLGQICEIDNDYEEAEKLYRESLQIAESVRDFVAIGASLNDLANLHQVQGNLDRFWYYAEKALRALRSLEHKRGVMILLSNIGMAHHFEERYYESHQHLSEACDISGEIGMCEYQMRIFGQILFNALAEPDLDVAGVFLDKARNADIDKEHDLYLTFVEGRYLSKLGKFDAAINIFMDLQGNTEWDATGDLEFELANIAFKKGQYARAEKLLISARNKAEEHWLIECDVKLGEVCRASGRLSDARNHFEKANTAYLQYGLKTKALRVALFIEEIDGHVGHRGS